MMIPDLVVDAIATHRLTRLATADVITQPARARIIRFAYERAPGWMGEPKPFQQTAPEWDQMPSDDDDAPTLATLVTCRWCAGIWISGFVVAARRYAPFAWDPLARLLVLSDAAALLARLEDG